MYNYCSLSIPDTYHFQVKQFWQWLMHGVKLFPIIYIGTSQPLPFVLIGDEVFPLQNMLQPFPGHNLSGTDIL